MHPSIWETIADMLFWLQLCWIVSGFILMAHLAFKVFPGSRDLQDREHAGSAGTNLGSSLVHSDPGTKSAAGNYRLEAFPEARVHTAKVIEFRSSKPEQNLAEQKLRRKSWNL